MKTRCGSWFFVRRSRAFGFSIDECSELLNLFQDRDRTSAEVKRIALKKVSGN
nr:MerR family DNA-binding protein [Amylibacter kogurei]